MQNDNGNHRDQAAEYWRGGKPLEAGRLIFESLPTTVRPKWAAEILRLVLDKSRIDPSPFWLLLQTADHQAMWGNGHRVFSMLRASTLDLLQLQKTQGLTKEQTLLAGILSLAELVAKVTYNATDPPDEFDEDSGWWIAACLRGFVDNVWRDEEFSKAAWSALCSEEG
jgi:hypothetical protein